VRLIDAHAHLVPPDYRAELERRDLLSIEPAWDLETTYAFMDRHGIDAAVLSLAPPGVAFGDDGLARDLARMVNEHIASVVASDAGRFAGLAVLPLPDVDAAIAEAAYALDVLGLDGVRLLSNVGGVYPGDEAWAPLFDALDARGAYVFLHPTSPAAPLALPDHPAWLYEFPFDTTRAVADLVYSGTLERCPNLRLQVAHLGGAVPFLADRLASLADREPARAREAPAGLHGYLGRLFFDTGLSNTAAPVAAARAVAPFRQLVFGTDWPYAALPARGDPAPGLAAMDGDERRALMGDHIGALIPRLVEN
jgi:predicted TIM-barrel fold metal-dependent hydrolase